MTNTNDSRYFTQRATQHGKLAMNAKDEQAAAVHRRFQDMYQARASGETVQQTA